MILVGKIHSIYAKCARAALLWECDSLNGVQERSCMKNFCLNRLTDNMLILIWKVLQKATKAHFVCFPGLLSLQKETDSNGLRWFFSDFKCAGFVSFWRCTAIFQHVASSSCCKAQSSHWLRGDNLANMLTEEVILHSARLIQIPLMNHLWCFFFQPWPRLDVRNRESSRSHRARLLFFGVCWFWSLTLMNDSELHGWRHTWDLKLCKRTCARQ